MLLSDVCLSVAYIGNNWRTERPSYEGQNWHRGSPRHTRLGHHLLSRSIVKGQLAAAWEYCSRLAYIVNIHGSPGLGSKAR